MSKIKKTRNCEENITASQKARLDGGSMNLGSISFAA
jgi:hypothetical protein